MYAAYFNLSDNPFAITPDPAYLYLSPHHQEALGHLLYGTGEDGGFVQLTGEVGTGKTTVIRALLKQDMTNVDVALCLNPRLTVEEFLASICDELHIEYPRSGATLKTLVDALNESLLARHREGRRTVLIVDEAQNLSPDVLEQVRLLTNLETHRHKLLRIILVGQPELQDLLDRRDLRQLAQRITARYHLRPLTRAETIAYIRHRIAVAGSKRELFTANAMRTVHRYSRGIPRLVNIICDRALLGAYAKSVGQVDAQIVRRAALEALQGPDRRLARLRRYASVAIIPLSIGLGLGAALYLWQKVREPVVIEVPMRTGAPTLGRAEPVAKLAVPVAPTGIDLEQSLAAVSIDDDVMRSLIGLWNVAAPLPAGMLSCESVEAYDLHCLSGSGGWAELRRYNRPAVLTLQLTNGETREVLLHQMHADQVVLALPEGQKTISYSELDSLWAGDFILLWRPPTGETLIGPSTTGESVRWLRKQLTLADGQSELSGPDADYFDESLRKRVRVFQTARGITADGLVGARTQILLGNLAPVANTPRLNGGAGDA